MKYIAILPLLLITALLWGQDDMDEKRMRRDIEVAENILAALIEDASSHNFPGIQVEGTYLDSYGLLFSIQGRSGIWGLATVPNVYIEDGAVISGRAQSNDRRESRGNAYSVTLDSTGILSQDEIKMLSETFLADYGYLLTQLPDNEKICIKYSRGKKGLFPNSGVIAFSSSKEEIDTAPGFTMVISKKAVDDLRMGSLNRQAFLSKIEYTENKGGSSEADRELILLNSIFNRLYQRDLSEGFFMRGNGNMERIAGLGILLSYKFSTGNNRGGLFYNNGQYRYYFDMDQFGGRGQIRSLDLNRDRDRDRDRDRSRDRGETDQGFDDDEKEEEIDEPDFDDFLEDFKYNVIEYGSTVRSLKQDEVLSFELSLPECRTCDEDEAWPENVKITARQSLLERYRSGGIDMEEAKDQLQVTY